MKNLLDLKLRIKKGTDDDDDDDDKCDLSMKNVRLGFSK